MPVEVTGRIHLEGAQANGRQPVPVEFSGELLYPAGVSATFFCSFLAENAQWAVVSGTSGFLNLSDFVLPFAGEEPSFSVVKTKFVTAGLRSDMKAKQQIVSSAEPPNNAAGSQEANLFRTLSKIALSGKLEARWPDISLKTQKILDGCLASARAATKPVSIAVQ